MSKVISRGNNMPEIFQTTRSLLIHDSLIPENLPNIHARIAEIAYYKSEKRGFKSGHDLDDWLEAERELLYFDHN